MVPLVLVPTELDGARCAWIPCVFTDEEDRPKLGDFGLARRAFGSGTLTEAGTLLGTAAYISFFNSAGMRGIERMKDVLGLHMKAIDVVQVSVPGFRDYR